MDSLKNWYFLGLFVFSIIVSGCGIVRTENVTAISLGTEVNVKTASGAKIKMGESLDFVALVTAWVSNGVQYVVVGGRS